MLKEFVSFWLLSLIVHVQIVLFKLFINNDISHSLKVYFKNILNISTKYTLIYIEKNAAVLEAENKTGIITTNPYIAQVATAFLWLVFSTKEAHPKGMTLLAIC